MTGTHTFILSNIKTEQYDRLMRAVGLSGKVFVPLLSSFACCAGIMTTSAIENPRDRIATIMIAPFMSCSARLPVYTLMIAAFFRATGLRDRNNFFRGRDVERANSRRLESLNQLVALSLMVLLCSLVSACQRWRSFGAKPTPGVDPSS